MEYYIGHIIAFVFILVYFLQKPSKRWDDAKTGYGTIQKIECKGRNNYLVEIEVKDNGKTYMAFAGAYTRSIKKYQIGDRVRIKYYIDKHDDAYASIEEEDIISVGSDSARFSFVFLILAFATESMTWIGFIFGD